MPPTPPSPPAPSGPAAPAPDALAAPARGALTADALVAALFTQSPLSVALYDADGRVAAANAAYERHFGVRVADVPADWSLRTDPQLRAAGLLPLIARAYAGAAVTLPAMRYDAAAATGGPGRAVWTQGHCYPVRDAAGRVTHLAVLHADVTAWAEAEAALRESEAKYRALFASMDQGFCIVEVLVDAGGRPVDYRFVEANPAFAGQTGLADAVGRTARALVPELEQHWVDTYGRVARTGEPARLRQRSAAMGRWFDVHAFRVGAPAARRVAILFTDVSAEAAAEQERERLLAAERAARAAAQAERDRAALLAEASAVLASSLDVEDTLARAVRLAVPAFADYCVLDLLTPAGGALGAPGGDIRRLAEAHVDPAMQGVLAGTAAFYPLGAGGGASPLLAVARGGGVRVVAEVDEGWMRSAARSAEHLDAIRRLAPRSLVVAALQARGEALGVITFVRSAAAVAGGGRPFGAEDAALAGQLASRAANAIDRARLDRAARDANEALVDANANLEAALADAVRARRAAEQARAEAERAARRTAQLQALTAALAGARTVEEVAAVVVAEVVAATGARTGMFAVRPPGAAEAAIVRQSGLADEVVERYTRFPLTAPGPAAACLRTGEAQWAESRAELLARYPDAARVWDALGAHAVATVPLAVAGATGAPEVVGAMSYSWAAPRPFDGDAREFFLALGRQAAQAVERARLLDAEREARRAAEAERERATEANAAKSQFLATMSHELRTPLNAIAGYTELLTLGLRGPLTAAQHEDLGRVRRANQHLTGLVTDVLNFARLEAGQVEFQVADVELGAVVADVEALVAPQLAAKGLAFDHDACGAETPSDPHVARADAEKVRQVLVNLLTNAIKFTERGGRVSLACATDRGAGVVRLRVTDTGRGIAPDQRERVFAPFVQVDRHRTPESQQGVGLGLAISRDLARGMGGDLTAESEVGVGSTFTLTLPAGGAA